MAEIHTDESALRGKRFHLKTKVAEIRHSHVHEITGKLIETFSIILVPYSNDETNHFLTAFVRSDDIELVADVAAPISDRGRFSLQKPNDKFKAFYLFVMSERIKERLKLMVGASVDVTTLPVDDPAQEESF